MNEEAVKKLAELSRLEILDDEVAEYAGKFSDILTYVDSLKNATSELDSNDLVLENANNRNVIRDDEDPQRPGQNTRKLISEAPVSQNDYIKVKKVL